MKKKGFTLVEIIAVIAIVGILMLAIVPNVIKIYSEGKANTFEKQFDVINRSAIDQYSLDLAEGTTNNVFCNTSDSCTKLKMQDNGYKYYVEINHLGKISYTVVSNNEFCYANNNSNAVIDKTRLMKESSLTCTSETNCTCVGGTPYDTTTHVASNEENIDNEGDERADGGTSGDGNITYRYWSVPQNELEAISSSLPNGAPIKMPKSYASNEMPTTTVSDPFLIGFEDTMDTPFVYIKSKITAGVVTGHQVCLNWGEKNFCLVSNTSKEALKRVMEGSLSKTANLCEEDSDGDYTCYFAKDNTACTANPNSNQCIIEYKAGVQCTLRTSGKISCRDGGVDTCIVDENGGASCIGGSTGSIGDSNDSGSTLPGTGSGSDTDQECVILPNGSLKCVGGDSGSTFPGIGSGTSNPGTGSSVINPGTGSGINNSGTINQGITNPSTNVPSSSY